MASSLLTCGRQSCRARLFTTSAIVRKSTRLPSFAEIRAIKLKQYAEEIEKDSTLQELKKEATDARKNDLITPSGGLANRLIKSFLYGSPKTKLEVEQLEQSYSTTLMRGKYVHEVVTHKVIPDKALEYLDLVSEMYPMIAGDKNNEVHLVGSWRTLIGDMDTYVHIWEYKGYPGFHHTQNVVHANPKYIRYLERLRPLLRSRESDLAQEFSFWGGTAQPHHFGGIFELRTYDLQAGKLMEWEQHWRKGIECRRQVMEPVGAWFSQLGRLNRVYHLWQFADLEHRKISREKCWELPGWAETVHETIKLINTMESNILVPLKFSPLR